jgi:hypothetical protein
MLPSLSQAQRDRDRRPTGTARPGSNHIAIPSYPFTAQELTRLASYGRAVRAGLYHEGWGPHGPDRPVQARLSFARPLGHQDVAPWRGWVRARGRTQAGVFAATLHELGVIRERVYLQDTPSGGLVFISAEVCGFGPADEPEFHRRLLAIHGLEPGRPGPAGFARLVLEWPAPT